MICLFLKEKRKCCLSFILLIIWVNVLIMIDNGFSSTSLLYLNMTLFFFSLVFLFVSFLSDQKKLHTLYPLTKKYYSYQSYFDLFQKKQEALKAEAENFCNELLVELLEQKDEQLAWIHEVKTPLTAMQLLLNQLPSSEEKSKLQTEWTRVYLLLDQTLHTLRLQEIKKDLLAATITLKELVLQEIKDLQSWCFNKGIQINIKQLDLSVITDEKWVHITFDAHGFPTIKLFHSYSAIMKYKCFYCCFVSSFCTFIEFHIRVFLLIQPF